MPLWGNQFLGRIDMLLKLTNRNSKILLWLDPNMKLKMIREADNARLKGLNVSSIFSLYDPKEHNLKEIEGYINNV